MMAGAANTVAVYLEIGKKRTFAGAVDWPGWCRSGRDADAALRALLEHGPRYAEVLHAAQIAFQVPADPSSFVVAEQVEGNTTTDFGAPNIPLSSDTQPVDEAALQHFQMLLQAYWQAFDRAIAAATGKQLRMGPRGGGRDLAGVVQHVLGAARGDLARLAWKLPQEEGADMSEAIARTRQAMLDALAAAARGGLPARGPRGGAIWTPRAFIRRVSWHLLDHVWEIEDRII